MHGARPYCTEQVKLEHQRKFFNQFVSRVHAGTYTKMRLYQQKMIQRWDQDLVSRSLLPPNPAESLPPPPKQS